MQIRSSEGEPIFEIDGGVDVALGTADESNDGIDFETSFLFGTPYPWL